MKKRYCRWSWTVLLLVGVAVSIGFRPSTCRAEESAGHPPIASENPNGLSEMFTGTVVEVIVAGRHIYVQVDNGKGRVWVAVPAFDGKPGDKVEVPPGVPVANFHSRKLKRTFKMIYFVGSIRRIANGTSK